MYLYDFNDNSCVTQFKETLKDIRRRKYRSQDSFAAALGFETRTSIANWESTSEKSLPTLKNLMDICAVLEVEPNRLLGVSKFDSESDQAISEVTGLSCDSVKELRSRKDIGGFIDYILSDPSADELLRRVRQISHYTLLQEAQETTFTDHARSKIQRAFEKFRHNVFPLDMQVKTFEEYVRRELPWESGRISVDDFIHSVVTENEYYNLLFEHPDFDSKPDYDKYDLLIQDIAATSYNYLMASPIIELAEQETVWTLHKIVGGFIESEVKSMRANIRQTTDRLK